MTPLRPGLHVVRRDDRHLQVGLDPPWRAGAARRPRRPAACSMTCRRPLPLARDRAPGHRALADLRRGGPALTDAGAGRARGRCAPATHRAGRGGRAAAARRGPRPVDRRDAPRSPLVRRRRASRRATCVDDHARAPAGRTSCVGADAARLRVGPFVVPGRTACLRCVDAHLGRARPAPGARGRAAGRPSGGPGRPGARPPWPPPGRSATWCATWTATSRPPGRRPSSSAPELRPGGVRGRGTRTAGARGTRWRPRLSGLTTTRCRACPPSRAGARASTRRSRRGCGRSRPRSSRSASSPRRSPTRPQKSQVVTPST